MIETNETLLDRVKRMDAHDAWQEFYRSYASAIVRYGRKLGLDEHRAQGVLQETMLILIDQMPHFVYDSNRGRFRNFLLTIAHRRSLAALRRAARLRTVFSSEVVAENVDPGTLDLRDSDEARWREALLEDALGRLSRSSSLDEGTYQVFRAYAIEGRSASEVADCFGLKVNAVYQIKNRVVRRLKVEISRRLQDCG